MKVKKINLARKRSLHRKALKAKKRFKNFTKNENKHHRRRSPRQKRQRRINSQNNIPSTRERIELPSIFSISEGLDNVLFLIYRTKKLLETGRYSQFDFDFSKVEKVDDGAATILLSLCHDISSLKKRVRVNLPRHSEARKFIQQAGFRKFFEGYAPKQNSLNETLKKGKSKILQKESAIIIHKAMKTVTGREMKNQRLQGMLIELMTNSVNHAYLANNREKSWYISTRHDTKEKRVEFCFVDNGDGIINTIFVRYGMKLILPTEDIIKQAFEGKFRSRTKLTNRGRGLIVIKNNFNKMTVKGLKVITNNVFLDFETGIAKKLSTPFSGTFYSWVIDESCKF